MHPGALLFAWIGGLIGVQVLSVGSLLLAIAGCGAVAGAGMRRRWRQLLRRSRILILVLGATFFLSTPGEALVFGMPGTFEGAVAAIEHVARFVMILATVAWVLDLLSLRELMAGLYLLASPLERLGVATRAAVARLALVLEYVEHGQIPVWRSLIDAKTDQGGESVEIHLPSFGGYDRVLVGTAVVLIVLACVG